MMSVEGAAGGLAAHRPSIYLPFLASFFEGRRRMGAGCSRPPGNFCSVSSDDRGVGNDQARCIWNSTSVSSRSFQR